MSPTPQKCRRLIRSDHDQLSIRMRVRIVRACFGLNLPSIRAIWKKIDSPELPPPSWSPHLPSTVARMTHLNSDAETVAEYQSDVRPKVHEGTGMDGPTVPNPKPELLSSGATSIEVGEKWVWEGSTSKATVGSSNYDSYINDFPFVADVYLHFLIAAKFKRCNESSYGSQHS